MPRDSSGSEPRSGASGNPALAVFADDDWEDFVAAVHYLPLLAKQRGTAFAIAWGKVELRRLVALLALSEPRGTAAQSARAALTTFYHRSTLRLMTDGDRAGFNARTAFIESVHREAFEPSVRTVFEHSQPSNVRPYLPLIPPKESR